MKTHTKSLQFWNKNLKYKPIIVYISLLVSILFTACDVKHIDLTPQEFPFVYDRDAGNGSTSQINIAMVDENLIHEHRFMLEVKPESAVKVSSIKAYITVNGIEYPMEGSGIGLWSYVATDKCVPNYTYSFRTTHDTEYTNVPTKTTVSGSHDISVSNYGDFVWFVLGYPVSSSHMDVTYYINPPNEKIIIRNLSSTPLALLSLTVTVQGIGGYFLLNDPTPLTLKCGESTSFEISWNGRQVGDIGAIQLQAKFLGPGNQIFTKMIYLTSDFHVPG